MELFILIAVAGWLSEIAKSAEKSSFMWGTVGAMFYLMGLLLASLIMGSIFSPILNKLNVLGYIIYIGMINVLSFGLVNKLCHTIFDQAVTSIDALARLLRQRNFSSVKLNKR